MALRSIDLEGVADRGRRRRARGAQVSLGHSLLLSSSSRSGGLGAAASAPAGRRRAWPGGPRGRSPNDIEDARAGVARAVGVDRGRRARAPLRGQRDAQRRLHRRAALVGVDDVVTAEPTALPLADVDGGHVQRRGLDDPGERVADDDVGRREDARVVPPERLDEAQPRLGRRRASASAASTSSRPSSMPGMGGDDRAAHGEGRLGRLAAPTARPARRPGRSAGGR